MELRRWQRDIGDWQQKTFGEGFGINWVWSLYKHLREELEELKMSFCSVELNREEIGTEMADIFILLSAMAERMDIDLEAAVRLKMKVNRERKWQKPDKDGVIRHLKDSPVMATMPGSDPT